MAAAQEHREVYLVTGAFGCIGSWVVRELALQGRQVLAVDLAPGSSRFELITRGVDLRNVSFAAGTDISNAHEVRALFEDFEIDRVIHLAALQVPFCRADPPLGYLVNVVGTTNVFEAARTCERQVRIAYTSSIGVYADASHPVKKPTTHYGVTKLANEFMADVYWVEHGLASVGIRPYVVYGPGRDQGMTASPTLAMAAAMLERSYKISFGGTFQMHFVRDVARQLISAVERATQGSECVDLGGPAVSVAEVVAAIQEALPGTREALTFDDRPLPFPSEVSDGSLQAVVGRSAETPLSEGVRETINFWRSAIKQRPEVESELIAML